MTPAAADLEPCPFCGKDVSRRLLTRLMAERKK